MVTGRALIEHGWPESPTIGLALAAARKLRAAGIIHRSAWNRNSANFAFHDFCEVRGDGIHRSSGFC
jgi:hypothetical protein